jgi:flagellar biosynthesis/type III secretory pathway chaperone
MKLVGRIARALNVGEDDVRFSTLISIVDGSRREDLEECRVRLRDVLFRIRETNRGNRALLDTSLHGVHNSMSFIYNLLSQGSTYMESGELRTGNTNGRICSRRG